MNRRGVLRRRIAVGLVWNRRGQLLLCRMSSERGVFPGKWGLPGGGVEPGEAIEQALSRELHEELGVEIRDVLPAFVKVGSHDKLFPDGNWRRVEMTFELFHCKTESATFSLNEEWTEARWVDEADLAALDLNVETRDTLARLDRWPPWP
jgi:nucleoside triphosphatase